MDPPIPPFDELVVGWAILVGLPTIVIGLLTWAFWITSYVPLAKIALRIAVGAVRISQLLAQYRPVAGIVSVFVSLVVPVAHIATLAMVFLVANVLTVVADFERGGDLLMVIDRLPLVESIGTLLDADWYIATWNAVWPFLKLNWITVGYTLWAVVLLISSYSRHLPDSEIRSMGYWLAWPAVIWCPLAYALLIVVSLDYVWSLLFPYPKQELGEFLGYFFFFLTSGILGLIYIGACKAAVWAPRLVFRLWDKREVSPESGEEGDPAARAPI